MNVYILGGGPTGLAIAHGLTLDSKIPFSVLECGPRFGGLAQTLVWKENGSHDLGPHKLFTLDPKLLSRVEQLLPEEDWLTRPKWSSIFLKGYFLPYPPSPFSLIKVFGKRKFLKMVFAYARARIQSFWKISLCHTFEEDLENRVGKELYGALFKPIAFKLWGDPSQLDIKLSQGRVQTPSLMEVIGRVLKLRKTSNFEALSFRYPRGGLQKIWDALLDSTKGRGEYYLNQEITNISIKENRVVKIDYKDTVSGDEKEIHVHEEDFVFSTLPLIKLGSLIKEPFISKELLPLIKSVVHLNDLILVFLKVDKLSLLKESWVFVPDPDIVFHRISEQESFDPGMTSDGSIVCCEIMSHERRPMNEQSDEQLFLLVRKGLEDMGYKDFSILAQRVIRLPSSYPVFRPGFEPTLKKILSELDQLLNFKTVGRQGAFNYIGTLDAMDIGYGAAKWLINKDTENGEKIWQLERERTQHYPVLD
ncbi:MAG: NAD(P)-binding protein [Chlamydiae bacterium]|nr:NAD(P)-binding protein [Chlamydiota bacterium]